MRDFKFLMLKVVGSHSFYQECVMTSLNVFIDDIKESFACRCWYKMFGAGDGAKAIEKYCKMSYEEILNECIGLNIVGTNIVLPTIPKIILSNVDNDYPNYFSEDKYMDITDKVLDKIVNQIDIEEIKEFVSSHTDDEIVEKYCRDKRFKDNFWIL